MVGGRTLGTPLFNYRASSLVVVTLPDSVDIGLTALPLPDIVAHSVPFLYSRERMVKV